MADEDLSLNEDQLLENLVEANGENETELTTEVSKPNGIIVYVGRQA